MDNFLNGDLDEMIDALNAADRAAKLSEEDWQKIYSNCIYYLSNKTFIQIKK